MNYPQLISNWFLDAIFPIRCLKCRKFLAKSTGYLCKKCIRTIPINKGFECLGCKRRVSLGKTCPTCRNNIHIDQLLIVSDYENDVIVKLIKTLKYRFIIEVMGPISYVIKKYIVWLSASKKFNLLAEKPVIIPVPLHPSRLNWRGFNQAELIACSIADILNCDICPDVIRRVRDKKPQAYIEGREQRLQNVKEIFKISDENKIKDETILLVDDVCTTGATLNECARVLKESGAKKVIGLVIARG